MKLTAEGEHFMDAVALLRLLPSPFRHMASYAADFWSDEILQRYVTELWADPAAPATPSPRHLTLVPTEGVKQHG